MMSKILNILHSFSKTDTMAGMYAFVLPLYTSFMLIGALVVFDTIFGLLANNKNGFKFSQYKFNTFLYKTCIYLISLFIAHAVSSYFGFDSFTIVKTLTSFIVINEMVSIDKNVEVVLGYSLFKFLITKLQSITKK